MSPTGRPFGPKSALVLVALLAVIVVGILRSPSAPPAGELELSGLSMGTTWTVRIATSPEVEPDRGAVARLVGERLDEVNRLMSTWDSASELSRFNRDRSGAAVRLSPPTLEVLRVAREVADRSGGLFDPTVGPLVDAWGFGPAPPPEHPPSDEELAALRERVGYRHVVLDEAAGTATKARGDVVVDLSAIAKGYAVDRVAEALEGAGIDSYLVEVGGEVRVGVAKPSGEPWRVAVEAPEPGERRVHGSIEVSRQGIATSGDYRNARVLDGRRWAHIVDPRTGRAILQRGFSVSVVASTTVVADAWATALVVLGPDAGYELAREQGVAALFLVKTDVEVVARATPGFPAFHPGDGRSGGRP